MYQISLEVFALLLSPIPLESKKLTMLRLNLTIASEKVNLFQLANSGQGVHSFLNPEIPRVYYNVVIRSSDEIKRIECLIIYRIYII